MLMSTAGAHDQVLRVEQQPGAFVVEGNVLLRIWPDRDYPEEIEERLRASIVLGSGRTPMQDIDFAIRQLVEVALRALSPGINDPFTAIECINRLAEGLCVVARRPRPSPFRFDAEDRLRVVAQPVSLQAMAHVAFDPIARSGGGNGDVAARLLQMIVTIASCAALPADRRLLIDFAHDLEDQMQGQLALKRDRSAVTDCLQRALADLLPHPVPPPRGSSTGAVGDAPG